MQSIIETPEFSKQFDALGLKRQLLDGLLEIHHQPIVTTWTEQSISSLAFFEIRFNDESDDPKVILLKISRMHVELFRAFCPEPKNG